MDGDFTDYKPGYYTVEFAQADDFRNKDKTPADLAKWGKAYAVKFANDAGTFYWSSRTEPQEGQRVFGHVEPSKTGKSMNFRRDEEKGVNTSNLAPGVASTKSDSYLKDTSNTPILMYNGSLNYAKELGLNLITDDSDRRVYLEYVQMVTNEMLDMIDKIRTGGSAPKGDVEKQPSFKVTPSATETLRSKWDKTTKVTTENTQGEPELTEEDMPDYDR